MGILNRIEDLDEKMDAVLMMEGAKISIEQFTDNFEMNIKNLTFEQKKLLVDLLVEKIEVTIISSQIHLNIKFRFDPPSGRLNNPEDEPKNDPPKPRDGSDGSSNGDYGATSRDRTCDPFLRREVL